MSIIKEFMERYPFRDKFTEALQAEKAAEAASRLDTVGALKVALSVTPQSALAAAAEQLESTLASKR